MQRNMGGGLPIIGFYEMKQDVYDIAARLNNLKLVVQAKENSRGKEDTDDRMRFCPYFEKEIGIELCTYVSECARGFCNKSILPEVTDWEKAEKLCNDCPNIFK